MRITTFGKLILLTLIAFSPSLVWLRPPQLKNLHHHLQTLQILI